MSRIARKPISIPKGVEVKQIGAKISVKGKKGEMTSPLHEAVLLEMQGDSVFVKPKTTAHPMVGTTCKMLSNMINGVDKGFEKKLSLQGVGYRAKTQGKDIELSLGHSHADIFEAPAGITIEVPSNTEIVIKGMDRQIVGETAAKIRALREPELYKGKGVRYVDEVVNLKEVKKK